MIIKIFSGRNIIIQFALILLVWIPVFTIPIQLIPNYGYNPLYDYIYHLLEGKLIIQKITFIILLAVPVFLTQIMATSFGLYKRHNYIFVLISPLIILSTNSLWSVNPVLFSLPFIILGTYHLFKIINIESANTPLSASAIYFSIGSLFYSVLIWDLFLILLALQIFRQFNLREMMLIIVSFFLPYLYLLSWYYLNNQLIEKWNLLTAHPIRSLPLEIPNHWINYVFYIIFALISIYIIFLLLAAQRNKLIQIRTYILFLLWSLFLSTALVFVAGENFAFHFLFIFFLIAVLVGIYLSDQTKNKLMDIFIFLFAFHYLYQLFHLIHA
jgi:hypothetical protein